MKAVAQRYANALVDVALERKEAERIRGELAGVAEMVRTSSDLRNFLASPAVNRATKHAVLEKLAARAGVSPALRNFLLVLADNRRAGDIAEIEKEFVLALHARLGIVEAEVTTARELPPAEQKELLAALEKRTGKRVEAKFHTDANLLAGAQVRIGSVVYDGSVREQLVRLSERLAAE